MHQVRLQSALKGRDFTQLAVALAAAGEFEHQAGKIAALRWGDECLAAKLLNAGGVEEAMHQKAEVEAGATLSGNWGELLVSLESAATEFFSLVRERSLIGRIAGLRRVPLKTRLVGALTG